MWKVYRFPVLHSTHFSRVHTDNRTGSRTSLLHINNNHTAYRSSLKVPIRLLNSFYKLPKQGQGSLPSYTGNQGYIGSVPISERPEQKTI